PSAAGIYVGCGNLPAAETAAPAAEPEAAPASDAPSDDAPAAEAPAAAAPAATPAAAPAPAAPSASAPTAAAPVPVPTSLPNTGDLSGIASLVAAAGAALAGSGYLLRRRARR